MFNGMVKLQYATGRNSEPKVRIIRGPYSFKINLNLHITAPWEKACKESNPLPFSFSLSRRAHQQLHAFAKSSKSVGV